MNIKFASSDEPLPSLQEQYILTFFYTSVRVYFFAETFKLLLFPISYLINVNAENKGLNQLGTIKIVGPIKLPG